MATHSGIFVWRIPWTEEPGRLQSIGWQRVRHDWSDLARVPSLLTWIHIRLEPDESLAKQLVLFLIAGLVVSKLDLVTFLEQMKNPWDVRRLETPAIYTGRCEWMEPMTQRQVPGSVRNSSFVMWFGKICFSGNDFREVWVSFCCCHRQTSPAPFCLLNHSWIHLQWLLFSIAVRTEILLACDNLNESVTIPFLGGPRKIAHFWKTLKTLLLKFVSTSRWQYVSGIVDILPKF